MSQGVRLLPDPHPTKALTRLSLTIQFIVATGFDVHASQTTPSSSQSLCLPSFIDGGISGEVLRQYTIEGMARSYQSATARSLLRGSTQNRHGGGVPDRRSQRHRKSRHCRLA